MNTRSLSDWTTIRSIINAAINAAEAIETSGYSEEHRGEVLKHGNGTIYDLVTSAWVLPENMRYELIRARHVDSVDNRYVPESARVIRNACSAAAEIIGAPIPDSISQNIKTMIEWHRRFPALLQKEISG